MKKREMALLWEVARTGSVTLASERVGMSQPSASALLRQLEERLGFDVFSRDKRKLKFTAKGRALLPDIAHALAALDSLARLAKAMRTDGAQRITIACVASVSATLLPAATARLMQATPEATLVVRTGMSVEIVNMVAEQGTDFGVIVGNNDPAGLESALIAPLELCCVMRPEHPWSARKRISLNQLHDEPYIALSRQFQVGALTAQRIEEAGLSFSPAVEVMQFSTACAFVDTGRGVALLDSLSTKYARKLGLVSVPLDTSSNLGLRLIWSSNSALSGLADGFHKGLVAAMN